MRQYKIINNSIGWLMFIVAAITYLLTIESTASFWDCGEFISQGYKLEVGHPPGNPIFMLAARFFINFASGPSTVAIMVNSMSALLSAGTILLLFWTITHLVKKLIVKDDSTGVSLNEMLVIFGSGIAGALVYTWSDTFWFSAVEGEVYAFSSFCTALVFWLILKWENRANDPHSDRYLILIAYVLGISIAVHLLNLLCIPAIVLVFYYKKWKETSVKGSILALLLSFGIIVLILYGLVPGFVKVAQWFELNCVNSFGMPFNSGVLVYFVIDMALFIWSIYELYQQRNPLLIKISFLLSIFFSGMLFIGDSWLIGSVLVIALALYLFKFCQRIPVRIFNIVIMSIFVIFIGYSSYAVILIRSNADTPMDQNSPDNVFSLASYLNREQYGQRPLIYGQTFNSSVVYKMNNEGIAKPLTETKGANYAKAVKNSPNDPDRYIMTGYTEDYTMTPELNMLFPRMYNGASAREYSEWTGMTGTPVMATTKVDSEGNTIESDTKIKPTFLENMQFFIDYQLNYMYWRYFMWNFAGRQNDIQGSGEITHGNWISGIPIIDNLRLGDQSLLPADLGKGNMGHNVFFMLPLILGIIGLLWQAYAGKRGIEQFWVIFFLFFMTGLAIVIYLNQTPSQPRERDYAFAGSFYAFAIWVGMGVAGLWRIFIFLLNKKSKNEASNNSEEKKPIALAIVACVIGIAIPLQMVSQTWDDHNRSGRYAARDFGMNYLSSVDKNAIIFTNGDNDTFPLWYVQEVEGYRTDVRVVNLSYLATDWYIEQMRRPAYESASVPMLAGNNTFAYGERQYNYFIAPDTTQMVPVLKSLEQLYGPDYKNNGWGLPEIKYPMMYIPVNANDVIKSGVVKAEDRSAIEEYIDANMFKDPSTAGDGAMSSSKIMSLDIIASNAAKGWKRPIYFAMTVPDSYYLGLSKYLQATGMAYELTPIISDVADGEFGVNTDKMYTNVMTKFRWGGLENSTPQNPIYVDETISRMVTTHRSTLCDLAYNLIVEGMKVQEAIEPTDKAQSPVVANGTKEYEQYKNFYKDRYDKARKVLKLMDTKLPTHCSPYSIQIGYRIAQVHLILGDASGNKADKQYGLKILEDEIMKYGDYARFYQSLSPSHTQRLSQSDLYIDGRYIVELMQLYNASANDKATEKIMKKLEARGVNVQRLFKGQE
ncbi:MAG: DUF2723 domain-containing protein [Muribaculaceae bacterium]